MEHIIVPGSKNPGIPFDLLFLIPISMNVCAIHSPQCLYNLKKEVHIFSWALQVSYLFVYRLQKGACIFVFIIFGRILRDW